MSGFSIPLSGLQATSASLNTIANNLANLNTDGFKDQSLKFADVFNQVQGLSGNGDPIQTGSGVKDAAITANESNGNLNSTGIASNMALQGNGFFVVQNGTATSYTRAGDFTVNSSGQLSTPAGELVMGYPATNGVVSTSSALAPISVNQSNTMPGVATSSFSTTTNLDSSAATGDTFSTPLSVYDSLGASTDLTIQYTKTGTNAWSYNITVPAATTGGSGSPTTVASGAMSFDSSGQLTSPTGSIPGINITGLADGAAPINLTWNLTDSTGASTLTQLDTTSSTATKQQNGFGVGTLTDYSVLPDGTVQGQFSNGQTLALGQVAVATFGNNQGLVQTGDNDYQATFSSGAAVVGVAGSGGRGTITGSSVEESNVDLSTEFSKMIVAQQGYEADAKALTTFDQVSQTTIQLIT